MDYPNSAKNSRNSKGSKLRCLNMTGKPREEFYQTLADIIKLDYVTFCANDDYFPQGQSSPKELTLTNSQAEEIYKKHFKHLTSHPYKVNELLTWWTKALKRVKTPNWDIVSTCNIHGVKGLVLVEAKAHRGEFQNDACGAGIVNKPHIESAMEVARAALNKCSSDNWLIHTKHYYQLSNRFAWAWKLASMGIPVVLVYLGFLNAEEWSDHFSCYKDWEDIVFNAPKRKIGIDVIPESAWETTIAVNGGGSITPIIRTVDMNIQVKA